MVSELVNVTNGAEQAQEIRLETRNFRFRKKRNCTTLVAKTNALIRFAVTAPLFLHMHNVGFLMGGGWGGEGT